MVRNANFALIPPFQLELGSLADHVTCLSRRSGHCICCDECTQSLLQRDAHCPHCRKPIRVVQRGDELNEDATFLVSASWLARVEKDNYEMDRI